jgi:hypothetical protein
MRTPRPHLTVPLVALGLFACGDKEADDSGTEQCGENAHWLDDHGHCHCDEGYAEDADGDCVEEEDDADTDTDGGGGDAFAPDEVVGEHIAGNDPIWLLTAKDGRTWLKIENHPSFGGASGPETRTLDETEVDYATCGVCVLLQTDCEPHGDHAHCETTFMPEVGGEVRFDALGAGAGESWAGALSGITFVEVEIGSDYSTTPVQGGDTFTLDAWTFDVVLEAGR